MSDQKTISAHVLTESGYKVQKKGNQTLILNSVLINLNRFFPIIFSLPHPMARKDTAQQCVNKLQQIFLHYFFLGISPIPWQGMPQLNHTSCEEPAPFPHPCSTPIVILAWKKTSLKCLFHDWSVHIYLILFCAAAAVPYHPSGIFSEPFPGPLKPVERGQQAPDTIFKLQVQNAFLQWHYDDFCLVFYSLLNNP